MSNTFYAPNDYRNYLAHFGVKGMKWGVRRYQNPDGSLTSAGQRRRLAAYNREQRKRIASRQNDERYAEYNRQLQNATDPAERMSIHIGARNKEAMNRADARTYSQLAKYSTFKPQRAYYEAKAFNADQRAKYYSKQHKKAGEDKIYEMLTGIDKYRTPYQTVTGKRITYGQHKLQAAAAKGLGLAGLATYAVNRNRKKHK